jgi:hypothetical protein
VAKVVEHDPLAVRDIRVKASGIRGRDQPILAARWDPRGLLDRVNVVGKRCEIAPRQALATQDAAEIDVRRQKCVEQVM